jgi:ketosteroid isomerase-like protein
VELVLRSIDSTNRGDLGQALKDAADSFTMDWSNSIGPLRGVYRGREQVTGFLESFFEAWDELLWDVQEIIDLDGEHVLVVNKVRMRGRASGVVVQATGNQVWTVRNGKLEGVKVLQSKSEALETAGLSEQDAHADS